MTYSTEWDAQYAAGRQRTLWPFSDLIGLVKRYGRPPGWVLELGCGYGNNMAFLLSAGYVYYGIDGNSDAVAIARDEGRRLRCGGGITLGDFTKFLPPAPYNLIVDRAAVAHNDTESIGRCLALVHETLVPGGLYIGVDWFSDKHDEYANGEPDTDEFTRTGYTEGQFSGVGRVHFSDEGHLRKLLERFELLHLEEKVMRRVIPGGTAATWNLVVRK